MRVSLHNPVYFFLLKALWHRICKKQKNDQNALQKSRKNPQNARKNPQTPANPENKVSGWFLHTVASFVVVFARHRDEKVQYKSQKSRPCKQVGMTWPNALPMFFAYRQVFIKLYLFFVKRLVSEEPTK